MSDHAEISIADDATGWLRDQPATWHEMNRALQDVAILLQFLGEQPDARLLGYFKDTQTKLADGASRRSVPPCDDYAAFLRRLFQIASAFQTGRLDSLPEEDRKGAEAGCCSAVAFVYWSRDFLAAVAAPATAESIRLTHDFLVSRAWPSWRGRRPPRARETAIPALPPDLGAPTRGRLAGRLALWVRFYESLTIVTTFATVLVSIYVLSGGLILSNERALREAWSRLDARLEAEEEKMFEPVRVPVTGDTREHFQVTGLCELTREVASQQAAARFAESGRISNDANPPPPATPGPATRTLYAMPLQAHLCSERAKALLNLFVATLHLQSWNSVITESFGRAFAYPFGVVPATLRSFAQGDRACFGLRPGEVKDSAACEQVLWDEIDRSRHVADSIQGALTQYLLPVLYGFLGAMAASMRLLRRKVDASLLSYTDRARLQQGAILGVLCGAVIGLFASFLGGTSGVGNIGVSAIALLAGYNVDGVFRFLDELSDRLFRPATPAKTS